MKPFKHHTGLVAPLDRMHVDTDMIIPKTFLRKIDREGFGAYLFNALRYLDEGDLTEDVSKRALNPDFVLNLPRYQGATILLARDNFGCGSSREHALWALTDYGFRCIIAPSFADIFYNNASKNALLNICLPSATIDELFDAVQNQEGYSLSVDLEQQQVVTPDGKNMHFDIDETRKHALLKGLDDIGMTLDECAPAIRAFETKHRERNSWAFDGLDIKLP